MAGQAKWIAVDDDGWSEAKACWIAGGAAAAAMARALVDGFALPPVSHLDGDLRLLVTELVNNGVVHGGADERDGLEVAIAVSDRTVRVEVTDPGPGCRPLAVEPPVTQPSGRGLLIVERLASRWGIETRDRTCAWAEIDLDGRPPGGGCFARTG